MDCRNDGGGREASGRARGFTGGADDANRRDVTERIEREEFARGHRAPGEPPAEPRPAATIVLARQAGRTYEVLLLRRPRTARFAAGAYVFPGGVIDAADAAPELTARLGSQCPQEPAALVAAIRELFEETGILLCDQAPPQEARRQARTDVLAGRIAFTELADRFVLTFVHCRVAYLSRWVTPELLSRRYDTRFFVAELGQDRSGEPELTDELAGFLWATPAEAVEMFRRGRLPMLFPTRVTLERLSRSDSLERVFEACRGQVVRRTLPRLLVHEHGVTPVLPGDPRYGEGT